MASLHDSRPSTGVVGKKKAIKPRGARAASALLGHKGKGEVMAIVKDWETEMDRLGVKNCKKLHAALSLLCKWKMFRDEFEGVRSINWLLKDKSGISADPGSDLMLVPVKIAAVKRFIELGKKPWTMITDEEKREYSYLETSISIAARTAYEDKEG